MEPDIVPLALYGRERNIEIRHIEFMPLDAQGLWDRDKVLTTDEMIAMLRQGIGPLEEIPTAITARPRRNTNLPTAKGVSDSLHPSAGRSA